MRHTVHVLALALACAAGAASAQPSLSLADAMERARQAGYETRAAAALSAAAEADLEQAKGARLPTVRVEEIWVYTDSPADVFGLELNQERFSFPQFVASDPNDPDFIDSATTRLEVSLPVYTGGEISARIGQAELAAEAAARQSGWTASGAALAAADAYVRLAQVRERVALLERSLETVQAHVDFARSYVEQGLMVSSELLRAEVELARIEDLLTEARGQARVAQANLSFRMAEDAGSEWVLEPLAAPEPLVGTLDEWLARVDGRGDLQAFRRQVEAAGLEEKVARAGRLPKVGLSVRHDLVDELPAGTHGDSTGVFAQGSIELWAGGRHRAAQAAARSRAEAAGSQLEQALDGARLEVRSAWEDAVTARERWHTAEAALAAAREAERITQERFEKGVVKTIDVLDATTARREAETRELVVRAEATLAGLRLERVAGRLGGAEGFEGADND